MIAQYGKRALALFLAVIMILSAVPVQVFAEDGHDHGSEAVAAASNPTEPTESPATEPEATEPPATEPEATEPEATEPEATEPEATEPEVTEPEATEPEATEPEATEPEATEPEATEPEATEPEATEPEATEPAESEALIALRAEIAAYIAQLGITPDMPDVMLLYAYGNHESQEAAQASLTKQDEFVEKGKLLSEAEQEILLAETNTKLCIRYREVAEKAYAQEVLTEPFTVNGVNFSNSGDGTLSEDDGTVTATVKGEDGCSASSATMYIYITNESGENGTVSFTMAQTSVNSIKIGDASGQNATEDIKGKTSYLKTLDADEGFSIVITTGKNATENILKLTNIAFTPATQSFTVNVEYPTDNGTVTSSVEGDAVDADGTTTLTVQNITAADGVTLTANSSTFLCWVDKDNKFLSAENPYTVKPSADTTVKAIMTGGNAHFLVNGKVVNNKISEGLVYGDLNKAVQMAGTATNKTIVLMNNGTLPADDYTIPSGVTLLIPYDDVNTLRTSAPGTVDDYAAPTVYRKLTMAEGAKIIVNGAMSLSAVQSAKMGNNGSPTGPCSFVQMNSGSNITVNNGGKLYVWGYIQGSGSVTVESGGTVYEDFQALDWRGGDNTSNMIDNQYRVFPMSQYYIQNVEVPMTLKAGAIENGYMSVAITLVGIQGSAVPFIGTNGMFNITSGYIVKDYDETTGRLLIDMYGDVAVKSLSISMKLGLIGTKTINSSKYTLPINGNMTINMHSGSVTMTQDIALTPGARLIIGKDANVSLGDGNKIFVYDRAAWGEKPNSFTYTDGGTHRNLPYPASAANVQGRDNDAYVEVNGVADLSKGEVYTTIGDTYIHGTGTIIMNPGTQKQTHMANVQDKNIKYVAIDVISPKLQNADGTYVETAGDTGKVIYKSVNGTWVCEHTYAEGTYSEEVTKAATCTEDGSKTLTCHCGDHSKTEVIDALGHAYEAVVTEPTCTEPGYTTHTCKNDASHTYTDSLVAALGHDEVGHAAQVPTCTEIGWDAYVTCSRCDYTTYVEKTALGHDEVAHEAKAPACGEIGWDAYVTCSRCDYTTYVEKAALDHDIVQHEAKAPTCTEIGWDAYVTCSRCDYTTYVEKAALGHDEVSHEAKAPTCTEIGWDAYVTCSRCDYTTYVEKSSLGHDEVSHAAKDPTCTEIGWDAYVTCSRCDYTTYAEKTALGHTEETLEAKAPTCTETGLTEGVKCAVCGETLKAQEEVPAAGHKWNWVNDKEATVLEPGIKHEECSVCHAKQNEKTEIPMLKCAHTGTMEETAAKAATCTEEGNSAYWYCSACQNYYSDAAGQHEIEKDSWVIKALGHTAVVDAAVAPDCTNTGLTEGEHCSVCGEVLVAQETVAALGHTEVIDAAVAPDCTNTGLTEGKHCSVCGEVLVAQETVAALGHTEVIDAAVAPDCTNTGLTEGKHCSVCGEVLLAQETVAALGHTYVEHGEYVFHCERCGDSFVQGITEIVGTVTDESSDAEITQAVEKIQNMETEQLKAVMKDETAGQAVVVQIEKLEEHVETKVTVEVRENTSYTPENVTIVGAKLNKVKNQAADITLQIDAAKTNVQIPDDSYNVRSAVKFSMTLENVQNTESLAVPVQITLPVPQNLNAEKLAVLHFNADGTVKEVIDPVISEDEQYASFVVSSFSDFALAENHKHDYKEVVTKPTCTEKGYTTCTCDCGDTYTADEVPATGHQKLAEVAAVAATCRKEGIVAHWHCDDCGMNFADAKGTKELQSVTVAIDHDAHTWAETGEETKATCSATGSIFYPCVNEGCEISREEILPIDPEAHVWDDGEPYGNHSCNSASYIIYTCTLCEKQNKVVDKEQHFRVPIADEIPATCTQDGMTSGWKCEKCDEFWIPQEVIPALGHDWNGSYPCQSETSGCTRCDLHFDSKQDHLVVVDAAVPATCTATGLTEGSHCGYCGQVLVAQTVVPMTDHNWIVADMEIPATCTTQGHKEGASYCLDCDYDADPIPMLEHEWMHRDAKKATYSAIGWNAHDYCLLCKATKTLEQYETVPCEFCGENPEGYIEIPMVEIQKNATLEEFLSNIGYLELIASQYAVEHPGTDPLGLVLNYMRTGVANYTTGSWAIMAGPENTDFRKYVQEMEDAVNSNPDIDVWVNVSGLKKLSSYKSPSNEVDPYNGNSVFCMTGHSFGTMDMTYYNKDSQNHADVGGWVGDLVDLLSTTDERGVPAGLTLEEKVAYIKENYLFKTDVSGSAGSFGSLDLYADLDAYYFMNELIANGYETGDLEKIMREYFQPGLTLEQRVSYLLTNRLDGLSTRKDLRTAVYNAYTSNKLITTLEGTRNFDAAGDELAELRRAVCYAFADEMCRIAGDYVEDLTNPRFTVFDSETKILAPGISQQINYATNADGNQIVYYVATADVARDDVGLWVNYYDRDPGTPENPQWKNSSVPNSAQNAQDRFGDPASADYIENFNVIASTNAGGYSMQEDATPGGLMVMNGVEWYPQSGSSGFFAILKDGTAYMGDPGEYESMKDRIQEAIGGFGEFVVKDGQVTGSATASDAPRTSVGITATGRVVIMCIDGRQAPFSSGASLQDVGYIMKEAGCVVAINLDGGGSTTFVARQPGSEDLTVMNRPSDGYPRNVSTNLLVYSTAPSSTAFDHAVIESTYDYATVGTPVQMTAAGVSPSGNAVDIPEGAVWAVSDEAWATIDAEGVFVAKRLGEVTVHLMLDGQSIGSKLMTVTNPDQLYFEKDKIDAIYGSSVVLPLRARIGGKPIAVNSKDVTITLSAPTAGTMDGFTFKAAESAIKTLTITASIDGSTASIHVMLYKQGENSFDFDKATGGSRMLAWDRQVTNAKLEDGSIYNVIDPAQDMVTSYTFALDMTAIPIPEQLEELTYMLPGGTMDGTNAWTFLTSLAQRISDLSWVKATVDFDDRFEVDYTELKVLNDYFEMTGTSFDEATNSLTITLNWIKQSQVIDVATANPLCIINGIKLTPRDGVWDNVNKITAVSDGTVGYEIYMRASGLYSFAQKPENQAVFGLYPYRNPADTSDAGGYFNDIYAEITDTYTLVNQVKEGWINEEGGFAYYVNGERLTGIQEVDGVLYDFGENGINVGQTKFTGLFFDQTNEPAEGETPDGVWRYSYMGELADGWQSINNEWYYFKSSTMAAATGTQRMNGVYYDFEATGKLVSGVWGNTLEGTRYYYGPGYHEKKWLEVDGEMYYFRNGYRVEGIQRVTSMENNAIKKFYDFGDDGICRGVLEDGLHTIDGDLYYLVNGVSQMGLHKVDGDYYFFTYAGPAVCSQTYYAWETHCDLPCSTYAFGEDGKMANGLLQMSDGIYYYFNGKVKSNAAGITKIGDDYYFVSSKGRVATGKYYCWATNCEIPCGEYEFGADGKMLQGVVEKADSTYYYVNGKLNGKKAGITKVGDDYYFVASNGRCATGKYYCWATNCELPCGEYEFGADGKMLQGIVEKDDGHYYYVNGRINSKYAGLTKVGDDYYFVASNGRCATGVYYAWATNCDLPCGNYEFGADGKMVQGIVVTDSGTYYYTNGNKGGKNAGLTKIGDGYYFVASNGRCATGVYNCWATNCDLPTGTYEFGPDGKMLHGLIQKDDGIYCYVYGKLGGNAGLVKLDDGYYFVANNGRVATGKYNCWKTLCDLPTGTYEFGSDGKMYNGFVTKSDGIYYYVNGKIGRVGLNYIDGYYYFISSTGRLVTNQRFYVWETNGLLLEQEYNFNELGQIVK